MTSLAQMAKDLQLDFTEQEGVNRWAETNKKVSDCLAKVYPNIPNYLHQHLKECLAKNPKKIEFFLHYWKIRRPKILNILRNHQGPPVSLTLPNGVNCICEIPLSSVDKDLIYRFTFVIDDTRITLLRTQERLEKFLDTLMITTKVLVNTIIFWRLRDAHHTVTYHQPTLANNKTFCTAIEQNVPLDIAIMLRA
jgi:hypothetical protein